MGVLYSTIFEGLRKSVGNLTMYTDGERQIVRKKTALRKDKQTEAQLRQRDRMRVVGDAWPYFSHHGEACFCTASGRTAWNRFVRANIMGDVAGNGLWRTEDWLGVLVAAGPLAVPVMEAEIDGKRREVTFRAYGSAWMRTMSQVPKPRAHISRTARVMMPRPQKGSASQ